jgi:hypothetical protein
MCSIMMGREILAYEALLLYSSSLRMIMNLHYCYQSGVIASAKQLSKVFGKQICSEVAMYLGWVTQQSYLRKTKAQDMPQVLLKLQSSLLQAHLYEIGVSTTNVNTSLYSFLELWQHCCNQINRDPNAWSEVEDVKTAANYWHYVENCKSTHLKQLLTMTEVYEEACVTIPTFESENYEIALQRKTSPLQIHNTTRESIPTASLKSTKSDKTILETSARPEILPSKQTLQQLTC